MKAELCKTCAHTDVCTKTKNLLGDVYVPLHPVFFTMEERRKARENWEEYEANDYPCADYINETEVAPVVRGKWIAEADRKYHWHCSECGYVIGLMKMDAHYCPNCGAKMEEKNETD